MKILDAVRSRTPVDMMFLDASVNTIGAEGFRYMAQVTDGGGSQKPGDALYRDLIFVPFPDGDPTHIPEWANVATVAGTVVFTAIQPRPLRLWPRERQAGRAASPSNG
jgi:hypothetical protein